LAEEQAWWGIFCGRKKELAAIQEAWDEVRSGQAKPQVLVLLAESGLGKTRIIQEFYNDISTHQDGVGENGYWPDVLTRKRNNLKINPEPTDCNPDKELAFLWWGLRMADPVGRNATHGGLSEGVSFLQGHLAPFAASRMRRSGLLKVGRDAAIDLAVEVGNIFTFGLLGIAKTVVTHGATLNSVIRSGKGVSGPSEAMAMHGEALRETVIADLRQLFSHRSELGETLPMILALDDAHWLAEDNETAEFIAQILEIAQAEHWPLLLLASHWEREWHEALETSALSFAKIITDQEALSYKIVKLEREPGLEPIVSAAFPGLTIKQRQILLDKADGNPRLLDEVLLYLSTKPRYFVDRSADRQLTEEATDQIAGMQFNLHDLIAERLADAPYEVQVSTALASLQGVRFSNIITVATAEALKESGAESGLRDAVKPHSLIAEIDEAFSEFAQRIYREVCDERLEDLFDREAALDALYRALVTISDSDIVFDSEQTAYFWSLAYDVASKRIPDENIFFLLFAAAQKVRFRPNGARFIPLPEKFYQSLFECLGKVRNLNISRAELEQIIIILNQIPYDDQKKSSLVLLDRILNEAQQDLDMKNLIISKMYDINSSLLMTRGEAENFFYSERGNFRKILLHSHKGKFSDEIDFHIISSIQNISMKLSENSDLCKFIYDVLNNVDDQSIAVSFIVVEPLIEYLIKSNTEVTPLLDRIENLTLDVNSFFLGNLHFSGPNFVASIMEKADIISRHESSLKLIHSIEVVSRSDMFLYFMIADKQTKDESLYLLSPNPEILEFDEITYIDEGRILLLKKNETYFNFGVAIEGVLRDLILTTDQAAVVLVDDDKCVDGNYVKIVKRSIKYFS
jgi:hypothetical protein